MSKDKKTRVTKKSRTIEEFVSAAVMMAANGQLDISKTELVDEVVSQNVVAGASKAVTDLMSAELSNLLETYYAEITAVAADELKLPYHYTSKAWYKRGRKAPQSELEAREYVVVFGNGRTGRAAGVRFVTAEDDPDPMLYVALKKQVDVINAAIATHDKKLRKVLASPSISTALGEELAARLPHLEGQD